MTKKTIKSATATSTTPEVLRQHAEQQYAHELAALAEADTFPRPPKWNLSPRAVLTYLLGGVAGDTEITPKYVGERRLMEVAVATLATDRALLLIGVPGTAKSWVSEHLAAAISGVTPRAIRASMAASTASDNSQSRKPPTVRCAIGAKAWASCPSMMSRVTSSCS